MDMSLIQYRALLSGGLVVISVLVWAEEKPQLFRSSTMSIALMELNFSRIQEGFFFIIVKQFNKVQ